MDAAVLFLVGKHADVILVVDRERLDVSSLFPTAYRDAHIDHSGSCHKQVNSARPREAREGDGGLHQVASNESKPKRIAIIRRGLWP